MKMTNVKKNVLRRTEILSLKKKKPDLANNKPVFQILLGEKERKRKWEREGVPLVSLPLTHRKTIAGLREDLALTNAYHKVMSLHTIVLYLE